MRSPIPPLLLLAVLLGVLSRGAGGFPTHLFPREENVFGFHAKGELPLTTRSSECSSLHDKSRAKPSCVTEVAGRESDSSRQEIKGLGRGVNPQAGPSEAQTKVEEEGKGWSFLGSGHADTTTASATTAKGSPTVGTGATTTSSGVTKASASSSPSAATTPGTKVPPAAPSLKPTQTSVPTGASRQTPTSTDGPTKASNAPATSPTGVGTAKTTASAKITTAPGPVSLPTTSVTATPPPQTPGAPSPTDGSKETTSSLSTSAAGATNITPAPKTSKTPTEKTTARSAPTQGSSATTPGGVAVNQDSVTTASGQSASSLGGSVAPTTARQNTPSEVPQASTSAKPEGTAGATVHQSHDKGSQPATLSPGATVVTTATEARPTQGGPPPGDQGNHTWLLTQTQFVCEEAIPSTSQAVVLTLNQSTPCDSFIKSSLEEPLLNMICKTLKPNFNRSRDHCLVRLAPVTGNPNALAIVGASVQINSEADELFESLKIKEGELKKLGLNVSYAGQYADIDSEDRFSMPLIITIVCMAASLLLAAAIYGCCHQRISQRKDQQRLTEELQTMENGYHDNPTLEVMETSSEMQEKKVNLNGELGDSWIVPMDSLTKEDLEEEEDTHL
uniref:podocalyxin n=1 Tax=Euleptes europaea TaxID=460621 RepID=UPI002540D125|nr:podocalyxin [Euleptes europaea]